MTNGGQHDGGSDPGGPARPPAPPPPPPPPPWAPHPDPWQQPPWEPQPQWPQQGGGPATPLPPGWPAAGVPPWVAPPPTRRTAIAAAVGPRLGARAIDAAIGAVLATVVAIVAGAAGVEDRPLAIVFLVFLALTAYETLCTWRWAGTPGKRLCRLRTVELDRVEPPTLKAAFRRGVTVSALLVLTVPGWIALLCSVVMSPLRRGFDDRAGRTMVVWRDIDLPVRTELLSGYADAERQPRFVALGRVGELEIRRRARTRRLTGSPVLVAAIALLILPISLPASTATVILITSAVWLVVFVIDETRLVARTGSTPGHRQGGLVIRSAASGGLPTKWRSFWRAVVLAFTLYVPVLWPLLAISLLRMKYSDAGRGLHDVAGGTVVVADPNLDPEEQRQRALSLQFGEVV